MSVRSYIVNRGRMTKLSIKVLACGPDNNDFNVLAGCGGGGGLKTTSMHTEYYLLALQT